MAPNPEETIYKDNTKDKKFSRVYPESEGDNVIISGMSGRFPNSRNTADYEYHLYNKIDMVDDEERRWKHFNVEIPKRSGKVYDLEKFDATFFGVHFKQAHTMDPQCRMLIESAYEAVLDAGINPKDLRGSRTGVFIGACISESEKTWFYEKIASGGFGITGCSRAMLANRVSYTLGLNGPSYLVDTACSSSLYALDAAFTAFRNGEIDAAIIGGANLCLHPYVTLQFARLGVLAPDGYCRPFDKDATGYTRSEAVNCMFLQKKRDAKRIYATVIYSKTNCDGYKPEGITYPAGLIQEKLLREFYNNVDISPKDLGYIEAHSTGTIVGDPEECRAIDNVLCKERDEELLVGSVKSNVGHSEAASGICSLVKVVLAFEKGLIAPNINFTAIRPGIPALEEGRLRVVSDVEKLEKPYIGVNSFGFGGANAHSLLRANAKEKVNFGIPSDKLPRLINWSGRTEEAINVVFNAVESKPLDGEFISLLHNIQRENIPGFVFRGYGLYAQGNETNAQCILKDVQHYTGINRPIVWLFSGMGSQWTEMGASLMDIPIFKASIEKCHKILATKGLNLIDILTSNDPTVFDNILHSFVGIAAVQIGIVDVLRALNLKPDYIIGHSVGELGCAYADEAFTAEQMILSAYSRGKVSVDIEKIKGSMAAVGLGYKKIISLLPNTIEAACHNGPDSTTISGPAEDVAKFVAELKAKKIFAKEVPCSNIAYHSRYIAHMGPLLQKYLKEIIPEPKSRSSKWLSSSVPRNQWDQPASQFSSAEYHTNNLLNSVLFEETSALLPHNALTIEIAPHGLLQAIIKKSMPQAVHIPLTQRGNKNNVQFFLQALGKLYLNGLDFPLEPLYPAVEWPVSRGTPSVSPLIKWDHSQDWFLTKFENIKSLATGERSFRIGLASDDDGYFSGHIIDGKVLVPAAGYLQYVWETLSLMKNGPVFMDMAVEFEDVRFLRATPLPKDGYVNLVVMIHYGTGNFEITEAGTLLVTGTIREIPNPQPPVIPKLRESTVKHPIVYTKDFYKELRLRGYHYAGEFRTVLEAHTDGSWGKVQWNYNWVTFIDNMFQINILGTDSRSLMLPTRIRKLRIFGKHHLRLLENIPPDQQTFEVFSVPELDKIVSGGIEVYGLYANVVPRRKAPGIAVLERYQFIPHFPTPKISKSDAVRICVQLALENCPTLKVKIVEVDLDKSEPIISHFLEALEDLPVVTGDYMFLSEQDIDLGPIHVEDGKLSTQNNCMFVVSKNCLTRIDFVEIAQKSLMDSGFLLSREPAGLSMSQITAPPSFNISAVLPVDGETLVFLQGMKKKFLGISSVVKVSEADTQYSWIAKVQTQLTKGPVLLVAQNEKFSGLLGLVNCLRKEPDGNLITCVFIDDPKSPPFDIALPFYENQLKLGFGINVYKNGKWGTYRHLQLVQELQSKPHSGHVYGNIIQRGDLTSLRWFEGNSDIKKCNIKVVYAALNFRDVMLAGGRLSADVYGASRHDQQCVFGLEICGVSTEDGRGVMGMIAKGGVSSYTQCDPRIAWDTPKGMTLQEAATIPVVYITVYYAFFWAADIRKGKTILIHSGTGGIGLSAIRVALGYGLEVYTTVGTPEKRKYLLDNFPQIKESHIGNSRDTSFEAMVMEQTGGKGVDFVLNSLAEDKLHASIRCLARGGHFLEIGKFDLSNDNKIGLGCFIKELSFHSIFADNLLNASDELVYSIKKMIHDDTVKGIVKPLPVTVFPGSELEAAFRYMATGKHIGKVLLQVRDDPTSDCTIPMKVIPQVYFDPKLVYIIPGGLGGFGLELADWMTLRGVKKLILSSSRGITKQYQAYRIFLWESYGAKVVVNTDDITTLSGCESLIKAGLRLGPIGGIFNLAVALRDSIFINQTPEKFSECIAPKACATKYLDQLSRKMCPQLQHFLIFSSVSCGRGNAGQTNYGMANSIMERIIEQRVADGLPGKAIQWGAVGEVGLVADMAEDKIDMEIGGTLQQRISSCLQELDVLLTSPDPIVSSMVVAEKRTSRGGKENIIETVMNIMSIRDLKSISMGTTLSEMGMDSLMAVEIKQTLERDFELILTPQDLRLLTFQKLHELSEVRDKESRDTVKMKLASSDKPKGIVLLLRNLGDQMSTDKVIFPLNTKNAIDTGLNKTIILPGLEGSAGSVWYNLGRNLNSSTVVLQFNHTSHLTTIPEIANVVLNDVIQNLKKSETFYLIGYSYGSLITLELAYLLEQLGYHGQILLVDGGPFFLKKLCLGHLGENSTDDDIWNLLFTLISHQIFPDEATKNISTIFEQLNSVDEKLEKFLEFVAKQEMYTKEYAELMIKAFFTRCKMAATLDLSTVKSIDSPITLVRPSEVALTDIAEDYELSKITKNKISIKYVEGNHSTMLENPTLAEIINDTDPALQEDKSFESYIRKK